ncbi:MAG: cell division protein ZapA [Cypionkella sp.]|uniref:cell division protein ZapA n=1 Tax=Cypionkella sp. TaxID=2811411 RepID=UPI002ABA4AFF|nr:cell division protein ZapA [Cypionkella sp.]MDZ4312847.1 cell division protein ZapA [Cypionkella sp.]MDZ4393726.1 cell division protein ZapA [Cypionkella sp.]
MPDLDISIGGRNFTVSCQPGEEHFLRGAANMLDAEAAPLVAQMGRLPESRMLLMAGLMLADKTAAVEDENRQLKLKLAEIESRPQPEREKLEVAVVPPGLREALAEIAARAEAMAASVEDRLQ